MKNLKLILGILTLISCNQVSFQQNYSRSAFDYLDSLNSISIQSSIPIDRKTMLTEGWKFHGWDTIPGKVPNIPDFSFAENTVLPHRIPFPNSNIWYSNEIKLDEGYLWIRADDGAQLWVNGKQILQNNELFFPIEKNPNNTMTLQIRVINNALSGGLKEVYWIDRLTFDGFREKKTNSESMLIQKAKEDFWIGGNFPTNWNEYPIWFNDPVILPVENDKLILRWIGEKNKKAKLYFGHQPNNITESLEVKEVNGVFSALIPSQGFRYYFFEMDQSISPVFKTELNDQSQEALFTVWSDSQGGWGNFSEIIAQMKKQKPQFTVGIGDLVGNGGNSWQYIKLLNELHQLPIPHYLFPGNHDYDGSYNDWVPKNFNHYLKAKSEANYKFWKSGPCVFVGLDPNENFPVDIKKGSDQYNWFTEIIQSEIWKKAIWKIVFVHQPPFSQGWKGYHGEKSIQGLLMPYWESGMIDLVISGHSHDYERLLLDHQKGKTGFLIVGGAGGSLEPDNEMDGFPHMDKVIRKHHFGKITADYQKLVFEAHSIEGEIIDKFILKK